MEQPSDETNKDPKRTKKSGGFSYTVGIEQIEQYQSWPVERRLQWLLYGNMLRKLMPQETIDLQNEFRSGER